jgi:hypothetical protein
MSSEESKEAPSLKTISLKEGYNQTYVIFPKRRGEEKGIDEYNDVFFRCGNWCYRGPIDFAGLQLDASEISVIIPTLQRQQNSLKFFCGSNR